MVEELRFMCMMATTLMNTISMMGYFIGWISYVFLKVIDCSQFKRLTTPKLQGTLV